MSEVARPASSPRPGQIPAFDAGWNAHEKGLERETVRVLSPPSGRDFALLAWDIREEISPRAAAELAEAAADAERTERNRAQRDAKIDNAIDGSIRMLLDGLEIDSIADLKRLVDVARAARRLQEALDRDYLDLRARESSERYGELLLALGELPA